MITPTKRDDLDPRLSPVQRLLCAIDACVACYSRLQLDDVQRIAGLRFVAAEIRVLPTRDVEAE